MGEVDGGDKHCCGLRVTVIVVIGDEAMCLFGRYLEAVMVVIDKDRHADKD